jgi:hypothetical protein
MRRLAVLAVAVGAVALTAVPEAASANAPERYPIDFVNSDSIDCSQFNPDWKFHDNFTDFFTGSGMVWTDQNGHQVRAIEHVVHVSNDVNSVTGFTLHEHNHINFVYDYVAGTVSLSGAINIMQRPGAGEVIHISGHKVFDLETGEPIVIHGPDTMGGDADFCRAVAP